MHSYVELHSGIKKTKSDCHSIILNRSQTVSDSLFEINNSNVSCYLKGCFLDKANFRTPLWKEHYNKLKNDESRVWMEYGWSTDVSTRS